MITNNVLESSIVSRIIYSFYLDMYMSLIYQLLPLWFWQIIEAQNRPKPTAEKERLEHTVSEAEREFLNHKGPLIDLHGPGSVFYLIKVNIIWFFKRLDIR